MGRIFLGTVISSYGVDERVQVADVDPSMLIEESDDEADDPDYPPCPICGDSENEELLFPCDGCGVESHTYCVGLEQVPRDDWFCDNCAPQRAIDSVSTPRRSRRLQDYVDRRSRGQRRQERHRAQASRYRWARVWQSVWDRLNLDLDFPFDDEQEDRYTRELSEHRDFRQWQRRLQIAERQGGANRFRETASALLDINDIRQLRTARERPTAPETESQEELRAWNALEKAKELNDELNGNRKKRRSPTASPADGASSAEPERPLKRPRTRRHPDVTDPLSDTNPEGSSSVRRLNSSSAPQTVSGARQEGPSFLQSLLMEVESSSAADESKGSSRPSALSLGGHSSPQHSSPATSPTSSNHASPRALSATPPPSLSNRPGSPLSLTSKVEPIFPPPEFSPARSPPEPQRIIPERKGSNPELHHPRPRTRIALGSSPLRSDEVSPPRFTMTLSAKEDIQKMVASALKPHYHSNEVSKDQYTEINRKISRMLYDKVGAKENLNDGAKETWEKLAGEEVTKAVQALKTG